MTKDQERRMTELAVKFWRTVAECHPDEAARQHAVETLARLEPTLSGHGSCGKTGRLVCG